MKLYDHDAAPNPRRARIFIAEKGLEIETIQVDLMKGAQFNDDFRAVNPWCTVPALELDDGTTISEVQGIWRYLEAAHPEPPLLGADAKEAGIVAMWENRVMLDGLQAVAEGFRNFVKGFKGHALPGPDGYDQIPELVERGRKRTENFFRMLDRRLGESEYIAGDSYTAADITAQVAVGFAGWIKMELPDELANAKRWHDAVDSRPSAKA